MQDAVLYCQHHTATSKVPGNTAAGPHAATIGRSNSFNSGHHDSENSGALSRGGPPRGSLRSRKEMAAVMTAPLVAGGAGGPVVGGGRSVVSHQQMQAAPGQQYVSGMGVGKAPLPPSCNVVTRGTVTQSASTAATNDHDAAVLTRQAHNRASFRNRMLQNAGEFELSEDREVGAVYARSREDGVASQLAGGQQYRTQSPIARNGETRRSGGRGGVKSRESPLTVPAYAASARGVSPRTVYNDRTSPYTVGMPATSPYTVGGVTTSPPRRTSGQFVYGSEEADPPRYEDTPAGQALKRQSPLQQQLQSPIHMQHGDPPPYYDAVHAVDSGVESQYGASPTYHLQQQTTPVPANLGQQGVGDQRQTPPLTTHYTLALDFVDHQLVPNTHHKGKLESVSDEGEGDEDPEVAALIEKAEALGKSLRYRSRGCTSSQSDPDGHSWSCTPQQFKFYMEQHVENIYKSLRERQARRMQLEREMGKFDLGEETREQMLRILRVKESNYLRVKRSKMDR